MQSTDGRELDRVALHERHRQIVRAFKQGRSKAAIGRDLGGSYSAVCRTIWRYEGEGAGSLAPARKGRHEGSGRYLSEVQSAHIRRLICEKRPEP
jgi:transposase